MSITLAATWHPRGETLRFRRLYPMLSKLYDRIIVIMPPKTHVGMVLSFGVYEKIKIFVADDWASGRYLALEKAVEQGGQYIHYVDLDRLVRWAETKPDELKHVVDYIKTTDFLVIGRSRYAYATHPQALVNTEALSNRFFSHILGKELDLSAGAKGMRRDVAEFILKNSEPRRALGTDAEWVILARRAGFEIESLQVNGLDWESADRYAKQAADAEQQRAAAAEYDAEPKHWKHRVNVASEIIEAGIAALKRELK